MQIGPVAGCSSLAIWQKFVGGDTATGLFLRLRDEQPWPDNCYEVFGRRFTLPRLQTWHADPGIVYSYSDNLLATMAWTPLLLQIRQRVEIAVQRRFNAVLVNYYRDAEDYVGWHSDDEIELGDRPYIASLSLGASREFAFRHKAEHSVRGRVRLDNGCLLFMQPEFQQHWQHSVPPATAQAQAGSLAQRDLRTAGQPAPANLAREHDAVGRINLTFRFVYPPQA